ncbi:DUF6088 family protein [Enterococcus thailandicus]|uniref:DUF6088 family protein n=1 Tax=Enterococcus thailandicus TaxID=417368 RepID=UPI0022E4370C|nr:DUF6088 family protein [Enterococcus thailandicus]
MPTGFEKIKNKIKRAPKGTLFILADFSHLDISYNTLKELIRRLVKSGDLVLVYRGIYQKPKFNTTLNRNVPASPSEIASTYARKNNWHIVASGDTALNQLGLTTQVPNTYQYKSSGPNREITLKNGQKIQFKSVLQREIGMNSLSALVIEALKAIGENQVNEADLKIIKSKLSTDQLKQLRKDVALSRSWIRDLIIKMEELAE